MSGTLPYCGSAPIPGELLMRFNLDPVLIGVLTAILAWHLIALKDSPRAGRARTQALAGWLVAAAALISPLCALSVALFSARVSQHMALVLVAAPLIAAGWPRQREPSPAWMLWASALLFFFALWFWHMPVPYEATFTSSSVYWAMHVTLFGGSILLWRHLIHHSRRQIAQVLAAGLVTFMHMGLLGAILTLAGHPLFQWHILTTQAWGLTALQDQQLGGAVMWVPGIALFLWTALRSVARLWEPAQGARPA